MSGICMSTYSCVGTSVLGFCADPVNIQCCIVNSELCRSYVDGTVSSIKGNGGVTYTIVKVRPVHLSDPSISSAAALEQDHTMTTITA